VVQIKIEKESDHNSVDSLEKDPPTEEIQKKDQQEDQEVPLEEMTKQELIEKFQSDATIKHDLYLRSQAEMENMKRRFQKDRTDLIKFSNEALIRQLLTVIDNLENAIIYGNDKKSFDSLLDGVELTLKSLKDVLKNSGLEVIESLEKPFDPNFHEAVSEQEDETAAPQTVLRELQKGYLLNQRLIRPAMVIVNKNKG